MSSLKKKEKLNDEEKKKLNELRKFFPELMTAYQGKEKFKDIFDSEMTLDCAFWQLVEWTESFYQYFPGSCQTIKRWIDEIVAYFDWRTTQGTVEGINQVDECHLIWGNICVSVWGKTNSRVEIPITNEKQKQTYYGAISDRTEQNQHHSFLVVMTLSINSKVASFAFPNI